VVIARLDGRLRIGEEITKDLLSPPLDAAVELWRLEVAVTAREG